MNLHAAAGAPDRSEAAPEVVDEAGATHEGAGMAPWLAWSLWAVSLVLIAVGLVLAYANFSSTFFTTRLDNVVGGLVLVAYATVGALIASRRPENPIGWIFCATCLLVALALLSEEYARYALITRPGALAGGLEIAWLTSWPRDIGFYLMFTFLLLLFPNGRLISPRWRAVAWLAAGAIALAVILMAFRPGPLPFLDTIDNPMGIRSAAGLYPVLDVVATLVVLTAIMLCAVSVIVRYRRAKGEECQQIKWFAYAAGIAIVQFSLAFLAALASVRLPWFLADGFFIFSAATLPVAAGIAILKYRLYDIDLLINRTLVYIPLTAILAGLYSASIALFQKLFLAVTGEQSDAAIVITTLILASSFTPIKNALQGFVDRRFKEAPDPTKKLRAFGDQVRSFLELHSPEQLSQRLLDEVISAFNATGGAIHLGQHGAPEETPYLHLIHTSGEWDGDAQISVPFKGTGPGTGGERLGLVSLGPRRNGSDYTPQDREILQSTVDVVARAIELSRARVATAEC
jgi:hypothetical protein